MARWIGSLSESMSIATSPPLALPSATQTPASLQPDQMRVSISVGRRVAIALPIHIAEPLAARDGAGALHARKDWNRGIALLDELCSDGCVWTTAIRNLIAV